MNRKAIFAVTVATPIIIGAVIVGAPAKWSHENPVVATGVVFRTETKSPSSWDLARAGLASDEITSRLGYPVTVRLNTHGACLFTESAVPIKASELAGLVKNVSAAKLERCKGF